MNSMSIRARLMISVGIAVFIAVTINGLINYWQARSNFKENVSEILVRTGDNTSSFVSNWFNVRSEMVSGAAQSLQLGNDIDSVVQQGQLAGKFEVMYVGTGDGQMKTYPAINLPSDYDPRSRPWYTQSIQAREQVVTPPYQDASSDKIVMTFAEPVGQDVIGADVELGDVVRQVLGVSIGESGYASLIDGDGNFLVHRNKSRVGKPLGSMRGGARLSDEVSPVEVDGETWLAAAFPIPGTDWKLLLMMEESDAMTGLGAIAWTNIFISALTIAGVVLVSGFMISTPAATADRTE